MRYAGEALNRDMRYVACCCDIIRQASFTMRVKEYFVKDDHPCHYSLIGPSRTLFFYLRICTCDCYERYLDPGSTGIIPLPTMPWLLLLSERENR